MDLEDNNMSQLNKYVYRSNCGGYETITKPSTDMNNYHHPSLTPPQPPNHKRQLSCDNNDDIDVPAPKKLKASNTHHRIAIIIPIMAKQLQHNIANYDLWRRSSFDVVLVFNKHEEGAVTNILHQYAPDMATPSIMHPYTTRISPNAGIAKHKAYSILKQHLNRSNFQFALLLDDTVNDIINTHTEESIITTPNKFYSAVKRLAEVSPIFGGTVAYKRHPKSASKKELLQLRPVSCNKHLSSRTPTLEKHFEDVDDEYIAKNRELSYRKVLFGEDIAFQVSLYEHGLLSKDSSGASESHVFLIDLQQSQHLTSLELQLKRS